jgi:hypothetical protein
LVKSTGFLPSGELESRSEMTDRTRAAESFAKRRKASSASREGEERRSKAYVLKWIADLVEEGLVQLDHTADGVSELRLVTGEVYRLGENTLRRIA